MASGTRSRHSSPSVTLSGASSSHTSPRLSHTLPLHPASPTPSPLQARPHLHPPLARPTSVHPVHPLYNNPGDTTTTALNLTSPRSLAASHSPPTGLLDDPPESPRPRKRPRLQSHEFGKNPHLKFNSSASTELDPRADMHQSSSRISATANKNGIKKDSTNGIASPFATNGAIKNGTPVSDEFFGHSREEVSRLMIQALRDLGYLSSRFPPRRFTNSIDTPPERSQKNRASILSRWMSPNFAMRSLQVLGQKRNSILPTFRCRKLHL